jgi:hypothetical protein
MGCALADEWWMRMRDQPAGNDDRLAAAGNQVLNRLGCLLLPLGRSAGSRQIQMGQNLNQRIAEH